MERPIAITPAFSAPGFATGAIAAWRDGAGTRWLLVPAESGKGGAIVAWKIVDRNGAPVFERGWVSRDMITPLTPIVVNDVIFAVSSGDSGAAAVLYALEGASGREIWNSGHSLSGFVTTGGLAAGGSRVYVATHDGVQYVFGFPIEH
jgi:outer membrane protein assembly factor BamB